MPSRKKRVCSELFGKRNSTLNCDGQGNITSKLTHTTPRSNTLFHHQSCGQVQSLLQREGNMQRLMSGLVLSCALPSGPIHYMMSSLSNIVQKISYLVFLSSRIHDLLIALNRHSRLVKGLCGNTSQKDKGFFVPLIQNTRISNVKLYSAGNWNKT